MSLLPSVVASISARALRALVSTSAFQLFGVGSLLVLERVSFATTISLSIGASIRHPRPG
jgi:hypothetical protein